MHETSADNPQTFRQRILEGIQIRFPLRRESDGEEFMVSVDMVTNDDGVHRAHVSAVDQFAMVYEEDREVVLPESLEVSVGEELVAEEVEDEEQKGRRIISPKLAAIVGGATLAAGAVVLPYVYKQHRNGK